MFSFSAFPLKQLNHSTPQHSAVGGADFRASLPGFALFANNH
jgi:hypothetical protein